MVFPFLRRFDQFLNNVGGGRLVGIPYPKVNDIFPTLSRVVFECLDLTQRIGWETMSAKKILHGRRSCLCRDMADNDESCRHAWAL